MLFELKKNTNNTWDMVPLSGEHAGECIATCDGVELAGAEFSASGRITGAIKAVWGMQADLESLYCDAETLRALCLNRPFRSTAEKPVEITHEGFMDAITNRLITSARQVLIMGGAIYRKG